MEEPRPTRRPIFRWWVLLIPLVVVLVSLAFAYPAYRDYQRRQETAKKIHDISKALEAHESTFKDIPAMPVNK